MQSAGGRPAVEGLLEDEDGPVQILGDVGQPPGEVDAQEGIVRRHGPRQNGVGHPVSVVGVKGPEVGTGGWILIVAQIHGRLDGGPVGLAISSKEGHVDFADVGEGHAGILGEDGVPHSLHALAVRINGRPVKANHELTGLVAFGLDAHPIAGEFPVAAFHPAVPDKAIAIALHDAVEVLAPAHAEVVVGDGAIHAGCVSVDLDALDVGHE